MSFVCVSLSMLTLLDAACAPSGSNGGNPPTGSAGAAGGRGSGGSSSAGGGPGAGGSSSAGGGPGGSGAGTGGSAGGNTGGSGTGGAGTPAGGAGGGGSSDGPVGGGDDGGAPPAGPMSPLPLVVTTYFPNRGWFGDASISPHFKPGLITETPGAGMCANRPPGAKGQCLQIKYTPPPGLNPPAPPVSHVGAFMLTTLRMSHGTDPSGKAGLPNWGLEPGVRVAPGARRIAFHAASEQPVKVAFHGGVKGKDTAITPPRAEHLTGAWKQYEVPLAGTKIGDSLVGGFGWTYWDTSKPATFYVDGIVWDAEGELPPVAPMGAMDDRRDFVFINRCSQPVWVGFDSKQAKPEGGGFRLDAGQTRTVVIPGGEWQGRFWGRTGCSFDAGGAGTCETGSCEGGLRCTAATRAVTLGEIYLPADKTKVGFYDISLVDGFNLPMAIAPLPGSHGQNFDIWDCGTASCMADVIATCPADQRRTNAAGKTVACISACERTMAPQFCCTGAFGQPETCPPFEGSRYFKALCPTAYSYAYDDQLSTFTCKGEDFAVWFCPEPGKP
jgi:hypothetical protein